MAVLERSDLQASPLADLHAIADQLGLEGFRRLRKAELIDAILAGAAPASGDAAPQKDEATGSAAEPDDEREPQAPRRGRSLLGRGRRRTARSAGGARAAAERDGGPSDGERAAAPGERGASSPADEPEAGEPEESREEAQTEAPAPASGPRTRARTAAASAEGVVELMDNGSAFLRVDPPGHSDGDVYISAAQVRRCELVSGDRVGGPVRAPRRSERYPSLVRIDTINGSAVDEVAAGERYEELPVAYASERLEFGSSDPTLEAIQWLTPLGRGSRAVLVGAPHSGKTEVLRLLCASLARREHLAVTLLLAGARPEEIEQWRAAEVAPAVALSLAASADAQGQAIEHAVEAAKRVASRGGDALVLIDGLDGLHPHTARKVLAAARNLRDAGSLTMIATATRPFGGETTVIALDAALTSTGRQPILDLLGSGTLRPELLVGEDGARAITQARAAALEAAG